MAFSFYEQLSSVFALGDALRSPKTEGNKWVTMKSKLKDSINKIFSTPFGFATFAFVVSQVGLLTYEILFRYEDYVENMVTNVLLSMIGGLIAAIFVYFTYKMVIDRTK